MIKKISMAVAIVAMLDITIVLWTMLQVASGMSTPHILFWDEQIRAILSVMN